MNKETASYIQILVKENVERSFDTLQRNIRQSASKYPENDKAVTNALGNYARALRAKEDFDEYVDELMDAEDDE